VCTFDGETTKNKQIYQHTSDSKEKEEMMARSVWWSCEQQ